MMKAALLAAAALAAFLATAYSVSASGQTVDWRSYKQGMEQGKAESKKILLSFFAEWCSYCRKMDQETFADPRVAALLKEAFVAIRLDVDKHPEISEKFRVERLPSIWFLDQNGERISNLPGFTAPDRFLGLLRYMKSDHYRSMTFSDFLQSVE